MNKLQLIGNVGRDPELAYTPNGTAVCKFSLAVTRRWSQGSEKKEETTWFNCSAWEKTGETVSQYVKKGHKLFVEGRVTARAYTDKNGKPAVSIDVSVTSIELLERREGEPGDHATASAAAQAPGEGGGDFPF